SGGPGTVPGSAGAAGSAGPLGGSATPSIGQGGGIFDDPVRSNAPHTQVNNSIVAGNLADQPDISGSFVSAGYNIIGDATGGSGFSETTDQVGTSAAPIDPKLGPLQDNGG